MSFAVTNAWLPLIRKLTLSSSGHLFLGFSVQAEVWDMYKLDPTCSRFRYPEWCQVRHCFTFEEIQISASIASYVHYLYTCSDWWMCVRTLALLPIYSIYGTRSLNIAFSCNLLHGTWPRSVRIYMCRNHTVKFNMHVNASTAHTWQSLSTLYV